MALPLSLFRCLSMCLKVCFKKCVKKRRSALLALMLSVNLSFAWAGLLDSSMAVYQVHVQDGQTRLQPATTSEPGQVLEYQLTYTSQAKTPLRIDQISVPVPANTRYIPDSSRTDVVSRFQVSIDGGKRWDSEPVKRQRKGKDGKIQEVIVPVSEYTHLRWQEKNPIKPGEVQTFSYRVKVL